MDARLLGILKKVYVGKQRVESWNDGVFVYGQPPDVDDADWAWIHDCGFAPNRHETATHDTMVERLRAAEHRVSWRAALDGFVLGCVGRWPRGRQTPISLAYAAHLDPHAFTSSAPGDDTPCEHCGLPCRTQWDATEQVFRLHAGYVWNELPEHYLPDLEEHPANALPVVTEADRAAFLRMLEAADAAEPGETPGQLAKRLGSTHFPRSDKYARYGMLSALAELGVLPNERLPPTADRFVPLKERHAAAEGLRGSIRSDVVLPLAAWRGKLGVDWSRVEALWP